MMTFNLSNFKDKIYLPLLQIYRLFNNLNV